MHVWNMDVTFFFLEFMTYWFVCKSALLTPMVAKTTELGCQRPSYAKHTRECA